MGTLYIVSTPIGNLKDITFRALETLQMVDFIACEDTRRTGLLLKLLSSSHPELARPERGRRDSGSNLSVQQGEMPDQAFEAVSPQAESVRHDNHRKPQLLSYHEHNEHQRIQQIISLIQNGKNVALVSDAGTPTISDPGFKLVRECRKLGIPVVAIPGVNAALAALTVSGLPTDKFLFLGYLPHKEGKRLRVLREVRDVLNIIKQTVIFYEAPHKLVKTLNNLEDVFGNIEIVIARELTKIHEEVQTLSVKEAIDMYTSKTPKGEFVVLFHPDGN